MKFHEWVINREDYVDCLYLRMDIFNPFKKIDPNIMIQAFNFLPQIGISLNRGTDFVGFHIGWLNAYVEFFVHHYKVNKKDK